MYLSFYQLREEPFRLTPDPRFLQLAEPHRNALLALTQGVINRKGLLVLSGPVGTGKTTVVNSLLNVLTRRYAQLPTALIVNPRLNRDELLETLLAEFEVPGVFSSKPCRLAALQRLMFSACKNGGTCVLIVDEAHLLTTDVLEEIRLLMNADSHYGKPLQVVLCGQPEVTVLLRDPANKALNQRIALRVTLRELGRSETRAYVTERLRIAGREGTGPFTSSAYDRIYEYSRGVPRLINILCDTCLQIGCQAAQPEVGEHIVEEASVRHELEPTGWLQNETESSILPAWDDSAPSVKMAEPE